MTVEEISIKIDEYELDNEEKAKLAAMILNEMDLTGDNLKEFLDTLDDVQHDELINRCADQESRG